MKQTMNNNKIKSLKLYEHINQKYSKTVYNINGWIYNESKYECHYNKKSTNCVK